MTIRGQRVSRIRVTCLQYSSCLYWVLMRCSRRPTLSAANRHLVLLNSVRHVGSCIPKSGVPTLPVKSLDGVACHCTGRDCKQLVRPFSLFRYPCTAGAQRPFCWIKQPQITLGCIVGLYVTFVLFESRQYVGGFCHSTE